MVVERPSGYKYFEILKNHLDGDLNKIFNNKLIYPRQIEIHLPADHKRTCNFHCPHCQGRIVKKPLYPFEQKALNLMRKLSGKIPFYIFGGNYTEPLLNPYFMSFLSLSKQCKAHFGIHTNGSLLNLLEEKQGWLTELHRIAENKQDYLSLSLDAGLLSSHKKVKGIKVNYFDDIIKAMRKIAKIRGNSNKLGLRVCYLLTDDNSSKEEIENIINIMKDIGVDSLRFSIPYDLYGKQFTEVEKYRKNVEVEKDKKFKDFFNEYTTSPDSKTHIFYFSPFNQDIHRMNFKQCIYCYYQITLGSDGNIYRCSSTATPSFPANILGKMTDDLDEFNQLILKNYNPNWNPQTCFNVGARCNRMALEINKSWEKICDEK